MDGQDWNPLTITSKVAVAAAKAARAGPPVTAEAAQARRVAAADGPVKLKTLLPESRQELIAKRVALKKNQAELNTLCNFPPNTIREIEAGRQTPSSGQLNTLNRILKAALKLG